MTFPLTQNLELIAAAPTGLDQIRQLVIELAVRGRLIAQTSTHAHAKQLLAASRKERQSAMELGKIKKEKAATEIATTEEPFRLPEGWAWCRVVDTGCYINGLAFKPSDWSSSGRPIIRIQNLSGRNSEFNRTTREVDASVVVRRGDILVSWSATLDAFVWEGEEGVLNQHIFRVEPSGAMNKRYLYWLMKWVIRSLADSDHSHGLVMAHINRGPFLAHPVALPPVEEQALIATRIDELMALCDRLEAEQADAEAAHAKLVEALLASLTQARDAADFRASWHQLAEHFHSLFTTEASVDALEQTVLQLALRGHLCESSSADGSARNLLREIENEKLDLYQRGQASKPKQFLPLSDDRRPYALPQGWTWARLGELGVTSTGSTPPTIDTAAFGGAVPFIGPGQIRPDGVITQGEKSLTAYGAKNSAVAKPGDLLMVCIGGSIGKCAVADRELAFNQQINCISVLGARPSYVNIILASPNFQKAVLAAATGSATPIINRSKWEEIAVPVPPLAVQDRIVESVGNLMTQSGHLKRELASAREHLGHLAQVLVGHASAVEA